MDAPTQEPVNHQDFRTFLQSELLERCRRNPRYSLRAFARALQIESSALSKILRGRRRLSESMLTRLSVQLGLSPEKLSYYRNQQSENRGGVVSFHQLTIDTFHIVSDWYHYAILELIHLQGFQSKPQWISTRLGIGVPEVSAALERLERVGLVQMNEKGEVISVPKNHTHVKDAFTDSAIRNFQKTMLEKAGVALEEISAEERDHTGMTMAINTKRLPEARHLIKKFHRELSTFLGQDSDKNEVYQLSVALFPLSRAEENRPKEQSDEEAIDVSLDQPIGRLAEGENARGPASEHATKASCL